MTILPRTYSITPRSRISCAMQVMLGDKHRARELCVPVSALAGSLNIDRGATAARSKNVLRLYDVRCRRPFERYELYRNLSNRKKGALTQSIPRDSFLRMSRLIFIAVPGVQTWTQLAERPGQYIAGRPTAFLRPVIETSIVRPSSKYLKLGNGGRLGKIDPVHFLVRPINVFSARKTYLSRLRLKLFQQRDRQLFQDRLTVGPSADGLRTQAVVPAIP